jgi:hypothetical protein
MQAITRIKAYKFSQLQTGAIHKRHLKFRKLNFSDLLQAGALFSANKNRFEICRFEFALNSANK